jgi:hypothetical protein
VSANNVFFKSTKQDELMKTLRKEKRGKKQQGGRNCQKGNQTEQTKKKCRIC